VKTHRTWLEISSEALSHNVEALRSCCGNEIKFIGVVKANAYGHGLPEVVRTLDRNRVKHFGVDSIEEAIAVRKILPNATIIVLGFIPDEQLSLVIDNDIQPVLYDIEQIRLLEMEAAKQGRKSSFHIKIETGTARQGIFPENLESFVREVKGLKNIDIVGLSTHFAKAEDLSGTPFTDRQIELFYTTIGTVADQIPNLTYVHSASSAAILSHSKSHGTAVRAGIGMYGLWPSSDIELDSRKTHLSLRLHPVLSWYSRVAQIKDYSAGTPIGYDGTEVLNKPTRVAIIPVGYYDGYDRRLSQKAEVLIRGHRCKVLGSICMNMMMVDASRVPSIQRGDKVTLIGQDGAQRIRVEELSEICSNIHWEIISRISQHLPRIVV